MTTAQVLTNPLGAVVVFDGGNPRTFTAKALETISGGQFVCISGVTNMVGSQISSFADGDLTVIGAIDDKLCNGIALNNAGSDGLVTVATRGAYLCSAGGVVSGGALVEHNESGAVENLKSIGSVSVGTLASTPIGRALSTSASGTSYYALISLNL